MSKDIPAIGKLSVRGKTRNIVRSKTSCAFGCPVHTGMPLLEVVSKVFFFFQNITGRNIFFGFYSRMWFMCV